MIVGCPTCGAEVEFRYDDSFVRVCSHCRSAVTRTDRGVETLGRFADLVPLESQLQLFAEGHYGSTGFLLIGMAQLRHAAGGVWQEWYAKLDGGQWAWISEAQGRLYLTYERTDVVVPSIAQLAPGTQIDLAGQPFTVGERGTATYVSALGEIPYRLAPNQSFQFVDLSDGRGGFATIDYGDGSEPPVVYVGAQVTPAGLGLSGGEAPRVVAPATGARLACPNCNGALELRAPDQTLRVACPYCNHLVSVEGGALAIIGALAHKPRPAIALGTKGTFVDGELTVIGFVVRSAYVDGAWWPFDEYLLYRPGLGFRWLVCSDWHWSYVQPIAPGAVSPGFAPSYDGVTFRRFQTAELRVDSVAGEFYWRVQAGEKVSSDDFIAPPAMLSCESTNDEQNWSLSTYMTVAEVDRAFGKPMGLAPPVGIAPNQPYPGGLGKITALVVVAFFAVGIGKCATAPAAQRLQQSFTFPSSPKAAVPTFDPTMGLVPSDPTTGTPAPASDPWGTGSGGGKPPAGSGSGSAVVDASAEPSGTVMFSNKFQLAGGHNLVFDLAANVTNNWTYASLDLVNDQTGAVVSFDTNLEYYAGVDDGESWDEGTRTSDQVLGPVEPGTYVLRVEAIHGGAGNVTLGVVVREGIFRWMWFWIFGGILAIPFGIAGLHAYSFNKRRWQNSNVGIRATTSGFVSDTSGDDDDD